ncbi:MAG: BlaI/MecI/CopY family transcriptional regulator [Sumerlaeia bacterium]
MPHQSPEPETGPPSLSPAEWDVMKPLWEAGALAARDIHSRAGEANGWAVKTTKSLLARLVAKGALDYEQVGNAYLYRACWSREEVTRHETEAFLERVFDAPSSAAPVVARLLGGGRLAPEQIEELRRLLDEREAKEEEESA